MPEAVAPTGTILNFTRGASQKKHTLWLFIPQIPRLNESWMQSLLRLLLLPL